MKLASSARVESLAQRVGAHGADVFFAWSPTAMGYLHGFAENGHERFMSLVVSATGKVALICPALSETQARRSGIEDVRTWNDSQDPYALVRALADEWGFASSVALIDNEAPAHMVLRLQQALPGVQFRLGDAALSELRRRKDPNEIALLKRAGEIADQAFVAVKPLIKPGITELDLQAALMSEMKSRGGRPTFAGVCFGPAAAEPHHVSDDTQLELGQLVLMDFGCEVNGYQSDITRCVNCGPATEKAKRVYDIVFRAHMAGRTALRPGVEAQSVDHAARAVIESEGFGANFVHRLGHGLGLQVHEEPNIVEGSTHLLEPGNVFSVEPGIYLPGEFGVRIENIVAVTESGHESMNAEPDSFLDELTV